MTIIRIDMIRYASNFIYFIFGPWWCIWEATWHWRYGTHLQTANLFVTALREKMSADHPIRRFLTPFTYQTIAINDNAKWNLCAPRSMGPRWEIQKIQWEWWRWQWHDFCQVFSWFENRKNWKMQFLCWKVLCFHRERDGLSIFFSSLFAKDWRDGAARRRTEFSTRRFQWSSDLPVLSVLKLVSQRDVERCEWLNFGGWKHRRSILWHVGLREVHQQDWSRYRILETGGRAADHLWAVPWRLHRMLLCNDTRRLQKKLVLFSVVWSWDDSPSQTSPL